MRQHRLHVTSQFLGWAARRTIPLRPREVNMRIPESGKHHATIALQSSYPRRSASVAAESCNLAPAYQNGYMCARRCLR